MNKNIFYVLEPSAQIWEREYVFTILTHVRVFPAVIKISVLMVYFSLLSARHVKLLFPNSCIPPAVISRLVE